MGHSEALQLRRRQGDRSRQLTKLKEFVETFGCATEEPSAARADIPDAGSDGNMLERSDRLARWLPPPRTGLVYVVINRRGPGPIEVGVKWGSWQKREPVPLLPDHRGLVLRLEHNNPDSWPLVVDTNGNIESGPRQNGSPPEWNDPNYLKVVW
jgi:hypothetical protein